MYKDIGGKIKHAAYIVFFLQIILYVVMGWLLLSVDMISCLLVIYFGLLISWFSSLFIYGFGELIGKQHRTKLHVRIVSGTHSKGTEKTTGCRNHFRRQIFGTVCRNPAEYLIP